MRRILIIIQAFVFICIVTILFFLPEGYNFESSKFKQSSTTVTGRNWKVTFAGAYTVTELSDNFQKTITAPSGTYLLVVDAMIFDLTKTKRAIGAKNFSVFTQDGTRLPASGFGPGYSSGIPESLDDVTIMTYMDPSYVLTDYDISDKYGIIIRSVFVVGKNDINQTFKLQFQDLEFIPFTIKKKIDADDIVPVVKSEAFKFSWLNTNEGLTSQYTTAVMAVTEDIVLAGTNKVGIFRSLDGGNHWKHVTPSWNYFWINDFAMSNKGVIYAGTNKGLYVSADSGRTWNYNNIGDTLWDVNCIAFHKDTIYIATNKGIMKSTQNLKNWEFINNGLKIKNQYRAVAVHPEGLLFGASHGIYCSTNFGKKWELMVPEDEIRYIWDIHIDAKGDIFIGTDNGGIFKSARKDLKWIKIYEHESRKVTNKRIKVLASLPSGHLFIGTGDKLLMYQIDNQQCEVIETGFTDEYVTDISFDPSFKTIFFSTLGKGIFHSEIIKSDISQ